jgi:rhodanese-related sulfurtransferase
VLLAEEGSKVSAQLKPKTKGHVMQPSMNRIHSPEHAKAYFEDKLAFTTGPIELDRWIKSGENNLVVVDVREAEDYNKGHIPGAINIPREEWSKPQGLGRDKTNVVYCYSQQCHLGANACVQFASNGYPVMELEGGFAVWKQNELDIEEASANRLKQQSGDRLAGRR